MRTFQVFIFCFVVINLGTIQPIIATNIDTTNVDTKSTNKDIRIKSLLKLAHYYFYIKNNNSAADSLAHLACIEAKLSGNSELAYSSIIDYCLVADVYKQKERALENIEYAEKIAKMSSDQDKLVKAIFTHTQLLIRLQDYKNAQDVLIQADNLIVNDKLKRVEYNLLLGEIFEMKSAKVFAYKSYANAKYLAVDIENDSLLVACYRKLSKFYSKNNEPQKSIEYYDEAKTIINNNKLFSPYDKLLFKWELVQVYRNTKQFELAIPLVYNVIEEAKKLNYDLVKNYSTSSLRSILLDNNNLNELYNFYVSKFPDELDKLKDNQPVAYNRIKSMIFEFKQNIDSALFYFNLAEQAVIQSNNNDYKAYFFKRKGEFFIRNGKISDGIRCFEKSIEFGQQAIDMSIVIDCSDILDSLYLLNLNYEKAFHFLRLNKLYSDSNKKINEIDKMKFAEVNHNIELENLYAHKIEQKKQKEHTLQLSFIVLIITFLLIILVVISNLSISIWVIKLHGYFTFVFLFEFIIYMLKIVYHSITHREEESPIESMIFKSILVALLLPLHHWTEKHVVHFLLNQKLSIRFKLFFQDVKNNLVSLFK